MKITRNVSPLAKPVGVLMIKSARAGEGKRRHNPGSTASVAFRTLPTNRPTAATHKRSCFIGRSVLFEGAADYLKEPQGHANRNPPGRDCKYKKLGKSIGR